MPRITVSASALRKSSDAYMELFNDNNLQVFALKGGRFEVVCGSTHVIARSLQEVADKVNAMELHACALDGNEVIASIQKKMGSQYRLEIHAAKGDTVKVVHSVEGSKEALACDMMGSIPLDVATMNPGQRYAMSPNMFGGDYAVLIPMNTLGLPELSPSLSPNQMWEAQPLTKGDVVQGICPITGEVIKVMISQAYPNGSIQDNNGKIYSADEVIQLQFCKVQDGPEPAFSEPDLPLYDSDNIPTYNPTGEVEKVAPMIGNLANYNTILEASGGILGDFMRKSSKFALADKCSLNKIRVSGIDKKGQATDGDLEWNVKIASPYYQRSSYITIPMTMVKGDLNLGKYFIASTGQKFPLTVEALDAHLGRLADDPFAPISKQSAHPSTLKSDPDIDAICAAVKTFSSKDRFGRTWDFPKNELCPKCGQPDSIGDCNHKKLSDAEVVELGGKLSKSAAVRTADGVQDKDFVVIHVPDNGAASVKKILDKNGYSYIEQKSKTNGFYYNISTPEDEGVGNTASAVYDLLDSKHAPFVAVSLEQMEQEASKKMASLTDANGEPIAIGDKVLVPEPEEGDIWIGEFEGRVDSQKDATTLTVIDGDDDAWDVDANRLLKLSSKKTAGGEYWSDVVMQQEAITSSETKEEAVQKLKDMGYVSTFTEDVDGDTPETIEECVDRVWDLYKDPAWDELNKEGSKEAGQKRPFVQSGTDKTASVRYSGRNTTLTELANGNLEIALTDDGLTEAMESDKKGEDLLIDLIEDAIGNGFAIVPPEDIGALTSSLIIGYDVGLSDDGNYEAHDESKIWWFPNYQVEDPMETLARDGKVIFTSGQDSPTGTDKEGSKKTTSSMFTVKVKHDNGVANIKTSAEDEEGAIKKVMEAEGCPRRAIQSVTKVAAVDAKEVAKDVLEKDKPLDNISGGEAEGKKPSNFDKGQLEKGIKVEMEHTTDPEVAAEIATDHLAETPAHNEEYYDKLETKVEKPLEQKAEAGKIKGPGIPDGTGPFGGTNKCPLFKKKREEKTLEQKAEASKKTADKTMQELEALWDTLGTIPTDDDENIQEAFLHFPVGTKLETVWHWFEEQNPDFVVHKMLYTEGSAEQKTAAEKLPPGAADIDYDEENGTVQLHDRMGGWISPDLAPAAAYKVAQKYYDSWAEFKKKHGVKKMKAIDFNDKYFIIIGGRGGSSELMDHIDSEILEDITSIITDSHEELDYKIAREIALEVSGDVDVDTDKIENELIEVLWKKHFNSEDNNVVGKKLDSIDEETMMYDRFDAISELIRENTDYGDKVDVAVQEYIAEHQEELAGKLRTKEMKAQESEGQQVMPGLERGKASKKTAAKFRVGEDKLLERIEKVTHPDIDAADKNIMSGETSMAIAKAVWSYINSTDDVALEDIVLAIKTVPEVDNESVSDYDIEEIANQVLSFINDFKVSASKKTAADWSKIKDAIMSSETKEEAVQKLNDSGYTSEGESNEETINRLWDNYKETFDPAKPENKASVIIDREIADYLKKIPEDVEGEPDFYEGEDGKGWMSREEIPAEEVDEARRVYVLDTLLTSDGFQHFHDMLVSAVRDEITEEELPEEDLEELLMDWDGDLSRALPDNIGINYGDDMVLVMYKPVDPTSEDIMKGREAEGQQVIPGLERGKASKKMAGTIDYRWAVVDDLAGSFDLFYTGNTEADYDATAEYVFANEDKVKACEAKGMTSMECARQLYEGYDSTAKAQSSKKTATLKTEQNTPEVHDAIMAAFKKSDYYMGGTDAIYEHGQWWVVGEDSEGNQVNFSVVDAEGPGSIDGFDFEPLP